MENASKALLISASVLIAIILIAVGIRILGTIRPTVDQVGKVSSSLEISIFNSQFTKYEGMQKGSAVRNLIRLVQQNNRVSDNYGVTITYKDMFLDWDADASEFLDLINLIVISKSYNISFDLNHLTGYVDNVIISE